MTVSIDGKTGREPISKFKTSDLSSHFGGDMEMGNDLPFFAVVGQVDCSRGLLTGHQQYSHHRPV